MSTNIEYNTFTIEPSSAEVLAETPAQSLAKFENAPSTVEGYKNEYSIVGDGLYAQVNTGETPQWLASTIDAVINTRLATSLTELQEARLSILSALSELQIAKNNYTELINIDATVDGVVVSRLEGLNATLNQNVAEIKNLQLTTVTPEEAAALTVNLLTAELDGGRIRSQFDQINTAVSNLTEATATSLTTLTSMLEDEESGLQAIATASEYLLTYVGIDDTGTATGTGLLSDLSILQKQNDGLIETYTGTHYIKVCDTDNVDPDLNELLTNQWPYALWTPMTGTTDPTATERTAYKDAVAGTYPILTNTVYTNTTDSTFWLYSSTGWTSITSTDFNNFRTSLRDAHSGDIYILYENVDNTKVYKESCKFIKTAVDTTAPYATDDDGYAWARITDTETQEAYLAALNAYDLADNKRRVFTETPFTPYDDGDLWVDNSGTYQVVKVYNADNDEWIVADEQVDSFVDVTYTPDQTSLKNQIDGKIEYYFYENYKDTTIPGNNPVTAINEAAALNLIDNQWTTQALQEAANGNVVYFKNTDGTPNAYWYQSRTNSWLTISDTSMYEALQTADGKMSVYFAISQTATPAAPGTSIKESDGTTELIVVPNLWFNNGTLKYYTGSVWADYGGGNNMGFFEGDELKTVVVDTTNNTLDYYIYEYVLNNWAIRTPSGLVAKSAWGVELDAFLNGDDGAAEYGGYSSLSSTVTTKSNGIVESAFEYSTNTKAIGGTWYNAGFGLKTTSGEGTTSEPYDSEFWVNANKFRFTATDGATSGYDVFTADEDGVTFTGSVAFTSVTGTPTHTSGTAIPTATAVKGSTYTQTSTTGSDILWAYGVNGWQSSGDPDALMAADVGANGSTTINGSLLKTGTIEMSQLDTHTVSSSYSGTIADKNGIRVYNNGVLRVKLGAL